MSQLSVPPTEPDILPFAYLLNAMEVAAWVKNPAEQGYAAKRRAVFDYVRDALRAAASRTRGPAEPGLAHVERAAIAMFESGPDWGGNLGRPWADLTDETRCKFRRWAAAALRATSAVEVATR